MPYKSEAEVPDYVPKEKRRQWMHVWNSVHKKTGSESRAFRAANSVVNKGS